MPLDLNDPKAIDYSSSTNLLPWEAYGDFDLELTAFTESGPPGTENNPGDKEYDLATCKVLKSTNPSIADGEETGLFFQTGGNGISVKNRPYKAAVERAFLAACFGEATKNPAFDSNRARKQLLAADLETEKVRVRLYRRKGNPMTDKQTGAAVLGDDGESKHFPEDRFISIP